MGQETDYILDNQLEPNPGVLYIVGTPIGNLEDFSPRAKNILSKVAIIACEDTRHSGQLFKKFKIKASLISFHKHNIHSRIPKLLEALKGGENLALVTDAGLPSVSDPGQELVSASRSLGHEVICIPGPCAAMTALVSSGLPTRRFCFEGFLPTKPKDRKLLLETISQEKRTTIIYEAPHRLLKLLKELSLLCGESRPIQIARELTKKHEEQIGSTIGKALKHFNENKPKGEFTLVLGGAPEEEIHFKSDQELVEEMQQLISNGVSINRAAKELASRTESSKNYLYALMHKHKKRIHS